MIYLLFRVTMMLIASPHGNIEMSAWNVLKILLIIMKIVTANISMI